MNYDLAYHDKPIQDLRFVISGGAGFIGSHLAEYLLQHGASKVRVIDNLATGLRSNIELLSQYDAFEFVEGDIRSIEDCRRACEGMDLLSHQAAMGSVPRSIKDPITTNDVNAGGFVNMLTAAREAGVKRVVFASSSSVYGDEPNLPKLEERVGRPLSPYAVSKKSNELYADIFSDVYQQEIIGLRYFNIFGPRQDPDGPYAAVIPKFAEGILTSTDVYINGDGEQSRDFTFVENAIQANVKALLTNNKEALGQIYNIAVGDRFTVNELYNTIAELLGSTQKAVHREERAGDIKHSLASIGKAQKLLGYNPRYKMREGLERTMVFYKKLVSEGQQN
jgi:UDP-N-acetylglucosamine 4-epimerase